MIDQDLLRRIRNDLPMPVLIAVLGRDGPPSKIRDGQRTSTVMLGDGTTVTGTNAGLFSDRDAGFGDGFEGCRGDGDFGSDGTG